MNHSFQSVQTLEDDISQYKSSNGTVNMEIQQLKRTIECLEQERHVAKNQREHMQEELNCVQTMCTNLKVANSNLCQHLEAKDEEVAEIQADKRDLMCKLDYLCHQWQLERSRIKELKERLGSKSQQNNVSQACVQELACSLKAAQKHLNAAQKKLDKACETVQSILQPPCQEILPACSQEKVMQCDSKWISPAVEQSTILFGDDPFMQQIEVLMAMLSKFAQRNTTPTTKRGKPLKHSPRMAIKDKETGVVPACDKTSNIAIVKSTSAVVQRALCPSRNGSDSSACTSPRNSLTPSDLNEFEKKAACSKSAAALS